MLPPALVAQVGGRLASAPDIDVCTLREPIALEADRQDPNCVKVVVDKSDRALLFSRAAIPYDFGHGSGIGPATLNPTTPNPATPNTEAATESEALADVPAAPWGWRHIGLYGYRVAALQKFVSLAPSALEKQESLEQLRLLENGISLTVLPAVEPAAAGVDTPKDLARVRELLA